MTTSIGTKCAVIMTFILGCGLLLVPYPAMRQLIIDRNLQTYNCSDARNFTYSGKSQGAYRATSLANLTMINTNTTTKNWQAFKSDNSSDTQIIVVKLHYPGLSSWLPYSFNSRADTANWFSGLNDSGFQCVADLKAEWGYTKPAIPNLPLYYASCAGGVVMFCICAFICCMNSVRTRRARYDYIYLN